MLIPKLPCIGLALLLATVSAEAQVQSPARFAFQDGKILLPFDLNEDRIYNLVYDTTAYDGLLERTITSPNPLPPDVPLPKVKLGDYSFGNLLFHGEDLRAGPGIDGIFPARWLPCAITFSFATSYFSLSPSTAMPATTDGYTAPLHLADDGSYRVQVGINGGDPVEAILDTRLAAALVLPKSLALDKGWLTPETRQLNVLSAAGEPAAIGQVQIRLEQIALGRAVLQTPVCAVIGGDELPRLGTGYLRRFRTRFDLPGGYLRVEPEATGAPADGPIVGVGITPARMDEEGYWLIHVAQASPADLAGLRPGDRLSDINRKPLKGASAETVDQLLSASVGEGISVGVLRGGEVVRMLMAAVELL